MKYYASISTCTRNIKGIISNLNICTVFQTEDNLTKNQIAKVMLDLTQRQCPFNFQIDFVGYIYEFSKDPTDYENCIKDFIYESPEDLSSIAAFLSDFNSLDGKSLQLFYDSIYN